MKRKCEENESARRIDKNVRYWEEVVSHAMAMWRSSILTSDEMLQILDLAESNLPSR